MGAYEEAQPQVVGYDDYYGFLGASSMYTEWRDVYQSPEIASSPERFALMQAMKSARTMCITRQSKATSASMKPTLFSGRMMKVL